MMTFTVLATEERQFKIDFAKTLNDDEKDSATSAIESASSLDEITALLHAEEFDGITLTPEIHQDTSFEVTHVSAKG
jgi:hypothetical protein